MASGDSDRAALYCALSHKELNTNGQRTVIFIHGAFSDGPSWDEVASHFPSNCHLLLPDLPSHGCARKIAPFSIGDASNCIRELIVRRARGGVANVVGHSLGADVALRLVSEYPAVVDEAVFVSGASTPSPLRSKSSLLPYAAWTEQRIEWLMPRSLIRFPMDGANLPAPNLAACTLDMNRQNFAGTDSRWPKTWPARTLIVAAGKGGLIPSQDNADTARKLAAIGRESNSETQCVVHPDMRHPWNYQAPALFAAAVDAWFHRREVMNGFVVLDTESC